MIIGYVLFAKNNSRTKKRKYFEMTGQINFCLLQNSIFIWCILVNERNYFLQILNHEKYIRSNPPEVFFGQSVLKICSKFMELHIFRTSFSENIYERLFTMQMRHKYYRK